MLITHLQYYGIILSLAQCSCWLISDLSSQRDRSWAGMKACAFKFWRVPFWVYLCQNLRLQPRVCSSSRSEGVGGSWICSHWSWSSSQTQTCAGFTCWGLAFHAPCPTLLSFLQVLPTIYCSSSSCLDSACKGRAQWRIQPSVILGSEYLLEECQGHHWTWGLLLM